MDPLILPLLHERPTREVAAEMEGIPSKIELADVVESYSTIKNLPFVTI